MAREHHGVRGGLWPIKLGAVGAHKRQQVGKLLLTKACCCDMCQNEGSRKKAALQLAGHPSSQGSQVDVKDVDVTMGHAAHLLAGSGTQGDRQSGGEVRRLSLEESGQPARAWPLCR